MEKILSEEFNVTGAASNKWRGIKVVTSVNRAKVDVRDKKAEVSRRNTTLAVLECNGTAV